MKSRCLPFMFAIVAMMAAQDALPPNGHTASVNGITIYYEEYGKGEPLVLLHGFNGSARGWQGLIPTFETQYRLIVPDLRGHGRSTNPTNKFTHRQSALDIYALLDQLGIQKFKAMGISSGGMTLLHMATQQPARVDAMVLIGATSYFPEQSRSIMKTATVDSMTEQDWQEARQVHKLGDDQIRALTNEFHNFKDSYEDMNFTPPLLGTITAKTLIVHGDRDLFFPVEIPLQLYRSIPNSFLWIVPDGGHVSIQEHLAEFNTVVGQFLKGEWQNHTQPH